MYGTVANSLEHVGTHLLAALTMAGFGDLFGLELVLLGGAWWLARKSKHFGEKFFEKIESSGSRWAQRKIAAPLALAAVVIAVRVTVLPLLPMPQPVIVDEFSHLLLADTLAHGRLANPPHPNWRSFEAIHVIPQPTYSSMYFPGPALLLWAGQSLAGHPWAGILMGTAALCALVCWALRGWFPARWALLGGILTALHIGLASYWMDSYWGGTFAAMGSALLFGAFQRLEKTKRFGGQSAALATLMALGIGMLANSRPYEGLMLCLPVAARMAWWLGQGNLAPKLLLSVLPLALCLAAIGAGMALYLQAVTGSATKLPYAVNQERYGWPLTLRWAEVKQMEHDRPEFSSYYQYEKTERGYYESVPQFLAGLATKIQMDWRFFLGPALTIPCLFLPRIWRKPRLRFLLLGGAVVLLVVLTGPHFPHYMAPALIPLMAVCVEGFRHLRQGELGLRLSRAIPVVLLATVGLRMAATPLHPRLEAFGGYTSWCCSNRGSIDQPSVERRLPAGRHLLLVRYRPDHQWMNDWVHNGADIDGARVVWARELGGETDRSLLTHFRGRQTWLVEPDQSPVRITPYPPAQRLLSGREEQGR